MMTSEKLAEFIVQTKLSEMPIEVVALSKNAMIDTLGVALAGSVQPTGRAIATFVERFGCKPVAGIIGNNIRTSTPLAALANGTIAHVLDYDDVSRVGTQGHTSAVLVSVVLSLGAELKASGRDIIEAYVIGVEIWGKIAEAMPLLHLKGWHPSCIFGTLGAASSAAKLLRLTADQTAMALGIACSEAAGLVRNFGSSTKSVQVGNAAKNGILAAMLAKDGFTSSRNILEGEGSFSSVFYFGARVDMPSIVDRLGKPYSLIDPGLDVKQYPSCGGTHRCLDAILYLISQFNIKPEDVDGIECQIHPVSIKALIHDNPKTALEGKFSMQFALAAAIVDRQFGLAQDNDEKVNDPVVKNLMKRIVCRVNTNDKGDPDSCPDRLVVRLRDGKEYSHEVMVAKGASRLPLSREELLTKFRECAKPVLKGDEIEGCIELVLRLEEMKDINRLMQVVCTTTG
jgi:2-methylcitrate dehydratase PrpD